MLDAVHDVDGYVFIMALTCKVIRFFFFSSSHQPAAQKRWMGSSRVGVYQGLGAERQEGQEAEDIGKRMTEVMSVKSQLDDSRK